MARRTVKIPIRWKVTTTTTVKRSSVLYCPFCGYVLRRSSYRTGLTTTCPNCRNNVRV